MYPTHEMQFARLTACRSDLMDNGIDLSRMHPQQLSAFVKEQLDYFQLMLGRDASCPEIVRLLALVLATGDPRRSPRNGARLHPVPPGEGSWFDKAGCRPLTQHALSIAVTVQSRT